MAQPQPATIKQALSQAKKAIKQGNVGRAQELYTAVLQAEPNNPVAKKQLKKLQQVSGSQLSEPSAQQMNELISLYQQGELTKLEFVCQSLLSQFPSSFQLLNLMAATQQGLGKYAAALASYQQAIKMRPDKPEPYSNRGLIYHQLGRFEEALQSLDSAIRLQADFADAHYNRGNTLRCLGHYQEALKSFSRAIKLKPDYASAYCNRGALLQEIGPLEQALQDFEQAIALQPGLLEAFTNRGNTLKNLGRLADAQASYQQALAIDPHYAEAHRLLSGMKTWQADDPQLGVMQAIYEATEPDQQAHSEICFALAKAREDLGDYACSFALLEEGNRFRKQLQQYHIEQDQQLFARIKQLFAEPARVQSIAEANVIASAPSKRPVFIVGMPRSGTSLVEQILASHSEVYGAGELHTMGRLCTQLLASSSGPLTAEQLQTIRHDYLEQLVALGVDEPVITDKMPINFRWIGFILSAIPEARIIHCCRDTHAVCWSIFKSYFALGGNDYSHDMADIAAYYQLYQDLMAFWEARFPGAIYALDYEQLTQDQEAETRKLLDFCGLEWDAQCLDFHRNPRAVKTVSDTQVRQKMYAGSSEAWKHYQQQLAHYDIPD